MPQLMKTPQEQQSIDSKNAGLNDMLNSLLQLAQPNGANNTMNQANKMQLNPYQEGVKKALKQAGEQQTMEAVQQGVPPEHIIQQSGFNQDPQQILTSLLSMVQQPQQSQGMQQQAQQPMQQPAQAVQQPAQQWVQTLQEKGQGQGFMTRFIQGAGEAMLRQSGINTLDDAAKAQKLRGQEPLQQGEREKLGMEMDKAVSVAKTNMGLDLSKQQQKSISEQMTKIITEPTMSGEAATKKLLASQGLEGAQGILDGMDKFGDGYIKQLSMPNSYEGQKLATFASMINEANARLPGGATLSKNELAFAKAISTPAGVAAQFTNPKYARQLTGSLVNKFKTLLKDVDPYSETRDKYKKAKELGYDDSQITEYFIKKGIVYGK